MFQNTYNRTTDNEDNCQLYKVIIQQVVTMPIYGKEALNICHPYMTDIPRYT